MRVVSDAVKFNFQACSTQTHSVTVLFCWSSSGHWPHKNCSENKAPVDQDLICKYRPLRSRWSLPPQDHQRRLIHRIILSIDRTVSVLAIITIYRRQNAHVYLPVDYGVQITKISVRCRSTILRVDPQTDRRRTALFKRRRRNVVWRGFESLEWRRVSGGGCAPSVPPPQKIFFYIFSFEMVIFMHSSGRLVFRPTVIVTMMFMTSAEV